MCRCRVISPSQSKQCIHIGLRPSQRCTGRRFEDITQRPRDLNKSAQLLWVGLQVCSSRNVMCDISRLRQTSAKLYRGMVVQTCNLESGTATMPTLGSMVQNGKLAA